MNPDVARQLSLDPATLAAYPAVPRPGASTSVPLSIRTARARTSGEYLVDLVMAPCSQELEPPANAGRFKSFNGKLRDELLDREIFHSLREAQVLIESWRHHYNAIRPHSALGYRPPAPETVPWPAWLPPRPTPGHDANVVYH